MEKIGEGYYYDVFELSPSRVVKKQTSLESRLAKLQAWYGSNPPLLAEKISRLEASARKSITISREVAEIPELKEILGNPIFINDYEYEQDRATPLETILSQKGGDEFLPYVKEYTDAHILLWDFGCGEVVYNFTLNAGVSVTTGKVVLLDFNDLSKDRGEVVRDIETRKWTTQVSLQRLKQTNPSLHIRTETLLDEGFTLETLNKHWGSRL
jgi:hypothetical protein